MKKLLSILSILSALLLNSCTKVIDINLNDNDPKVVIEAIVNADSSTHYVTLTNSINFDEDVAPPVVTGATITIKEVNGSVVGTYSYDSNLGKYVVNNFLVKEGASYEMTVVANGKSHTAISTVPTRVKLDSMKVVKYPFGPNLSYTVVPMRMDPAGIVNYYQFKIKRDGKPLLGIYVEDDQAMDGQLTLKPIFPYRNELSPDTLIGEVNKWKKKVGNTIEVKDSIFVELEMECMENKIYRYFLTLSLNQGNQQSATPSNPDALFTNGALGYFSAQTVQKRTIWITNK
jgi:hypothetical protein